MGLRKVGTNCKISFVFIAVPRPRSIMAIVCRSLHRRWVPIATIAGAMLVCGGERLGELSAAGLCGTSWGGSAAPAVVSVLDVGKLNTADQQPERSAAHDCFGTYTVSGLWRSRASTADAGRARHTFRQSPHAGPATAVRIISHARVRVTRLLNGSILCCRERPLAHIVALPSTPTTTPRRMATTPRMTMTR